MKKTLSILIMVAFTIYSCEDNKGASQDPDIIDIIPGFGRILLKPGQTYQLAARVIDKDNQEIRDAKVTWLSENKSVATVSDNGLVTAIDIGSTNITATYESVQSFRKVTNSTIKRRVLSEMFTSST